MFTTLNQQWNLDAFFPGGSSSPAFASFLDRLEEDLNDVRTQLGAMTAPQSLDETAPLKRVLEIVQDIDLRAREAGSFTMCLTSEDAKDEKARLLNARTTEITSGKASLSVALNDIILQIPQDVWNEFLQDEEVRPIGFVLDERRRLMAEKLPPEQEVLANDLAIDGYHAYWDLYNTLISRVTIPYEQDGQETALSLGQAAARLSDPDRAVRQTMFDGIQNAMQEQADLFAHALNHMSGFRLNLYRQRGWDSFLKEPLDMNRMSEQTLNAMWDTISANKAPLVQFLERKAKLLGLDKLEWHDMNAPLGKTSGKVAYEDAAAFIIEQFEKFSPQMAEFARQAFENRWIEAEDRPGKLPGGYCTPFPVSKQTRIFMTYNGTSRDVDTLAHELGHSYHDHVMADMPALVIDYAMNVAETASTFAEVIVSDAALKRAESTEERIALLDSKNMRTVLYLMNVHAAFGFEKAFYTRRQQGPVSVEELSAMMEQEQRDAFCGALGGYYPTLWTSRLHHYLTDIPFYNFPYTFGFLFSTGIYARSLAEGPAFEAKYVELLRDTGRMTVEELAEKHLGVDLTQPEFWQGAIDLLMVDIEEFLRLTA